MVFLSYEEVYIQFVHRYEVHWEILKNYYGGFSYTSRLGILSACPMCNIQASTTESFLVFTIETESGFGETLVFWFIGSMKQCKQVPDNKLRR